MSNWINEGKCIVCNKNEGLLGKLILEIGDTCIGVCKKKCLKQLKSELRKGVNSCGILSRPLCQTFGFNSVGRNGKIKLERR